MHACTTKPTHSNVYKKLLASYVTTYVRYFNTYDPLNYNVSSYS